MNAPDDTSSGDGAKKDVADSVKFLGSALCVPVTVRLTRLTMKEINQYQTKVKQKKKGRYNKWRFGAIKTRKLYIRKWRLERKHKECEEKEKPMICVDGQEKCYEKTETNKEKISMDEQKTDASIVEGNEKRLRRKRKYTDTLDVKQNILPRKRQKLMSFATTKITRVVKNIGLSTDVDSSTRNTKDDCIKHTLSNTKQLNIPLIRLEDIKDDIYVDIWRSKSLTIKDTEPNLTFKAENDKQLSKALGSVALHLNTIYPSRKNKKRNQTDSHDSQSQKDNINTELSTNLSEVPKKSLKLQRRKRDSGKEYKLFKEPKVILTKLDNEEAPTSSLDMDETQKLFDNNDDDDEDLINEITLLTNGAECYKESNNLLDKTLSMSSLESSPRPSPILGRSAVKHQTVSKLRWNMQNTYNTANETSNEKSLSDINSELDKSESKVDETGVRSLRRTTARSQWRLAQRPESRAGCPSTRVSTRTQKKHITRSLSRIEFHSPSRSSSRSLSPDVTTDSSKAVVHDRKKSTTRDSSRSLKYIPYTAETDASSSIATRRSNKDSSLPPSSVTSVGNDNTIVTRSSSPAYSTKNNLATLSIKESSVSLNKSPARSPARSPTRSPVRPSIHSPSRTRSTLAFMSPKKSAKSSVTELQTLSSDNSKRSEITPTTDTSEIENTPATVECQQESERISSEDEDSIELIIDDESTKETTETTLSTLPLRNTGNEFSTDQDQVVPMQESTVEFSESSTEMDIRENDDHHVDGITVNSKRSASVISTERNPISDVLDNKQKSATPKILPTRRIKALGRVSLGRTKPDKSKSVSKFKNSGPSLKCIVCDSEYKTYKILQEHLKSHSGRQTTSTSGILATDPCSDSMLDANAREQTFQDIGAPPSMCSKTACSVDSSSTSNEESRSLRTQVTECASEISDVPSTPSTKTQQPQKKSKNTPSPTKSVKSKERKIKYCNSSNSCSVCFQKFESKVKLAEHIYAHTEEELQIAYESARASESSNHRVESVRITLEASKLDDKVENSAVPLTVEASNIEVQDLSMNNAASTSLKSKESQRETDRVTGNKLDKGGKHKEAKSNSEKAKKTPQKKKTSSTPTRKEVSTPKSKNPPVEKESERTVDHIEVITLDEPETVSDTTDHNQSLGSSSDGNTERETMICSTKPITVCECHRNDVTYGNYLRIEVSLLCHSCRTVYRSMECFEIHYRLPQHAECNKNRLHGRSPKLFCTNCGMIFSSIQDVRQHLELHARYNTNVSTDFRCNLCKVIFIGIGSLFYIHWSNHLKNPLYIASKLSFPKNSVLTTRNKHTNVKGSATDEYLHVAEHVCDNCKESFSTGNDLEKHYQNCKQITNKTTPNKIANPNNDARMEPKIRLVCGICEQIFLDKFLFEKHAELKHKQHTEPQYICVALTTMNTVFSCSACTKMYGKLQDLENHWKTHDTKRERYMCKNCDKLHDSLESFVEHAKQHVSDISNGEVSCKVIYQESEFICKPCKFGFDSKVTMNKHFEMHGVNLTWQSAEKTFQQHPTDLCMTRNSPVDPLEIPQNKAGKKKENVVTGIQQREEQKSAPRTGNDKNEVNASCGQEEAEASEGELVIDYREMSEDERLQKTREKVTPLSTPVEVSSESKDRTSTAPIEEANVPTDCTKKSTSHNPEPPRKGFLRVKTLAELTDDNVTRENQCFICKSVLNSTDELANHVLTTHSNVSAEQFALHQSKGQGPSQGIFQPPESRNKISNNTTSHPLPSKSSHASDYQPMLKIHGRLMKCGIKGKSHEKSQQQKPTWHTSEDRPVTTNHTPKPVSGYHKNLPACPSTRPLSTATQRLPVRNTIPIRPKETASASAILKIPQPVQPQLEQPSRTTMCSQTLQRPVQGSSMSSANNTELNSNPAIPTTAIQAADDYNCRICPQFKGASVADYILHELSAEHESRKKTLTSQSSTTNNLSRSYEQLVAETTSNERTSNIHTENVVVQNQQQQPRLQEVYATEVYSEPMIYAPVETNRIINYSVPRNVFVNTSNITQNVTPLNTQTLITMASRGNVYQPVVFNNPTGIAVINSYTCFFCRRTFVNNNSLNLHINMNHPYACILCREEFPGVHELEAHKIKHSLVWN